MTFTLILGGARSGKSRFAQAQAEGMGLPVTLIATAQGLDDEMTERIARHRADRDGRWRVIEEPYDLPAALRAACAPDRAVVVDCLTLWLSNLMHAERDVAAAGAALIDALASAPGAVFLVSNEVGLGLVPDNPLGRAFRDAQGWLNQSLAQAATRAIFVAAGLPLILKDETPPAFPPVGAPFEARSSGQ